MVLGDLDSYVHKNETQPPTSPYTNINSGWIKDLTIICDTIKVLEENMEQKNSDAPCSNTFTIYPLNQGI